MNGPVRALLAIAGLFCAAAAPPPPLVLLPSFAGTCGGKLICNGDAAEHGALLRLVPAAPEQSGAAYLAKAVHLDAGQGFVTAFTFRLSGNGDAMRADGLAFLLARDPTSLGDPSRYGGSMGFEGVGQSFAVEFDVFDNGNEAGGSNHIALDRNGVLSDTAAASPFGQSTCNGPAPGANCMSNGDTWTALIGYNGRDHEISVAVLNGNGALDLVIDTAPANLDALFAGAGAYVGFGAGTGDGRMNHDLTSWAFSTGNPNIRALSPTNWMLSAESSQTQAAIAEVPEPASATILALGLAALAARRKITKAK